MFSASQAPNFQATSLRWGVEIQQMNSPKTREILAARLAAARTPTRADSSEHRAPAELLERFQMEQVSEVDLTGYDPPPAIWGSMAADTQSSEDAD